MLKIEDGGVGIGDLTSPGFQGALDYWEGLRGDRFAPSSGDLEFMDFPPRLLPYVTVAEIPAGTLDFVFSFWGTGHLAALGEDYSGFSVQAVRPKELSALWHEQLRTVACERRPMAFVRTIRGFVDGVSMRQEVLRLPLSGDARTVDGVMSVSVWDPVDRIRNFYRQSRTVSLAQPVSCG